MRSGRGFLNDLNPNPDITGDVSQPTLVIATRNDGSVPFAHARSLTQAIPHATLVESQADSHFIWLGPDWPAIADTIRGLLTTRVTERPKGSKNDGRAEQPTFPPVPASQPDRYAGRPRSGLRSKPSEEPAVTK
jgi:hypothetical protein